MTIKGLKRGGSIIEALFDCKVNERLPYVEEVINYAYHAAIGYYTRKELLSVLLNNRDGHWYFQDAPEGALVHISKRALSSSIAKSKPCHLCGAQHHVIYYRSGKSFCLNCHCTSNRLFS